MWLPIESNQKIEARHLSGISSMVTKLASENGFATKLSFKRELKGKCMLGRERMKRNLICYSVSFSRTFLFVFSHLLIMEL